jgi:3-oxoacyl-[acyl-carrier protein] reductase
MKEEIRVNKVALVTGSSRGIGRAIAIELAKSGIDIVVNNFENPQEGIEVVNEIKKIGQRAMYIQVDVSDPNQVENMIEKILNEFGRIDILINNAGIVRDKKLENMSIDQWNRVISVNLTGTFNYTKSVIKYMKEQGGGKIINIASVVGEIGNFGQSNYAASKGGVIAFTKTVAKEYARDGINVNAVAPGFIKTKMVETVAMPVLVPENLALFLPMMLRIRPKIEQGRLM